MDGDVDWLIVPLALIYAVIFWVVSLQVPSVPLALILGLAPFQNDISGFGGLHFSISELHLLLSAPLLCTRVGRIHWGWMGGVLASGLAITILLTVPNWRETSTLALVQMGLYWIGAVFLFTNLPRSSQDFALAWKTLITVGCLLGVTALVTGSSYFFGLNKNGIGASLACTLMVTMECWICAKESQRWKYVLVLLLVSAGLVFVLSRGAWISALAGLAFLLMWRSQYLLVAKLAFAAVPVVAAAWMVLPAESRDYALAIDDSRYNIHARSLNADFAREQWLSSPLIGVGAGLRKEYDATNVLWLTLAETGPVGLLTFLTVNGALLVGVWRRRPRRPSFTPDSSAIALAGALVLGKLVHGMVDHYWSRGAIMIAWASVGMALSVESRTRLPRTRGGVGSREKESSPQNEELAPPISSL
jgi:hypothetical protein